METFRKLNEKKKKSTCDSEKFQRNEKATTIMVKLWIAHRIVWRMWNETNGFRLNSSQYFRCSARLSLTLCLQLSGNTKETNELTTTISFFSPPMTVSVFMSKPYENLCIYDLCQYSKQSLNIDASILAPISAAFDLIAVRDEFHSKLIYKSSLIRPINRIINHSQFDGITCEITHTRTKNECLEIGDWSMWYAPAFFSVEFRYIFHIISISISSSHRNDARKGRGLSTHSNVYAKFRHKSSHFSRMYSKCVRRKPCEALADWL